MFQLKREIKAGEIIPSIFWGFAYAEAQRNLFIIYPIPLNFVVRWSRDFWIWLHYPGSGYRDKLERSLFHHGFCAGQENIRSRILSKTVNDLIGAGLPKERADSMAREMIKIQLGL